MNRRNVLKGLTAALAGSMGLAFGSGAFTQTEADREFSVGVASDDTGAQLVIEESPELDSAAVDPTDNNSFEFNTTEISPDAISTFGVFETITDPGSLETPAFVVRNENETGTDVDVSFGIEAAEGQDVVVELAVVPSSEAESESVAVTGTSGENSDDITLEGIPSTVNDNIDDADAAELDCGLVVDTTADGISTDNLDITLSIQAERSNTAS